LLNRPLRTHRPGRCLMDGVVDFCAASPRCPAVVGVCDGFVGNRRLAQRWQAGRKLLFRGLAAAAVRLPDRSQNSGMPMGPFAMVRSRRPSIAAFAPQDSGHQFGRSADALCESLPLRQKTKKPRAITNTGPAPRAPRPDPEVRATYRRNPAAAGRNDAPSATSKSFERNDVADYQRGRAMLEEDRARPSYIDVICSTATLAESPGSARVLRRPVGPQAIKWPAVI